METFGNTGDLMRFLRQESNTSADVIPKAFVERMAAALDDDAYGRPHIERILRGDVDFTENSDPIDGEGREQKVHDLVEKFQKWRYSERWLFLSAATSDEEKRQRAFEFENFKKEAKIPEEDITKAVVEDIKELYQIVFDFIGLNKGCDRPMNILVLGHGSLKCTTNSAGKVVVGSGQLAMLVNIENFGSKKISVENDCVIDMINKITQLHQIEESNMVHLCLFYCYAHAKEEGKVCSNFKVITYKNGKNPGSLLVRDKVTKELIDSENNAMSFYTEERDKQESGEPHRLYPAAPSAPVKASAPGTETAFLPSGDGQDEEKDVTPFYLAAHDQDEDDPDEVNLSGDLRRWKHPQRNLSVEDTNKKFPQDSSNKDPNEDIAEESDTEEEGKVIPCSAGDGKSDEVIHPVDCSAGVNKDGEKEKKESESEDCRDGWQRKLTMCSETDEHETTIVRGCQKGSMVITHRVDEMSAVEVTAGNQDEDSQQQAEEHAVADGRRGWALDTWGRVKNALSYIDWYPYM